MMAFEIQVYGYKKEGGKTFCQLYCTCGKADCDHLKTSSPCKSCGARLIWAKTIPKRKNMPVNFDDQQPHWATCDKTKEFKR